ncbi:hypothetical protein TGGT1_205100 [Toxoplasma gondii GT1]|uniref:Transmembrane protein n=5 Tax=Toxoplasma gondii TaxID=5811 RepID=S7W2Z0_TOXGG|nr:hypothetical protein TGGT1_205100 [Toxoplasma gondii GT1]
MVLDVAAQGTPPSLAGQSPPRTDLENDLSLPMMSGDPTSERLQVIQSIAGAIVIGGWIVVMRVRRHSPVALFKVYAFLPPVLLLCASAASFFFFSSTPTTLLEDAEEPFSGLPRRRFASESPASSFPTLSQWSWDSIISSGWPEVRRCLGANYAAVATLGLLVQAVLSLWRILAALNHRPVASTSFAEAAGNHPALPNKTETIVSSSVSAGGARAPHGKKGGKRRGGESRENEEADETAKSLALGQSSQTPGQSPQEEIKETFGCRVWRFEDQVGRHWGEGADWRQTLLWRLADVLVISTVGLPLLYQFSARPQAFLPEARASASAAPWWASLWSPESLSSFRLLHPSAWLCLYAIALVPLQLLPDYPSVSLQFFEALCLLLLLLRHSLSRDATLLSPADSLFSLQARGVPGLEASDSFFLCMQALRWSLLRPMANVMSASAARGALPRAEARHSATAALSASQAKRGWVSRFCSFFGGDPRKETKEKKRENSFASKDRLPPPSPHCCFLTNCSSLVVQDPSRSGGVQGLKHIGPPLFVDADGDEAHEFFHVGISK